MFVILHGLTWGGATFWESSDRTKEIGEKNMDVPRSHRVLVHHQFQARAKELCETRSIVRSALGQGICPSPSVEDIVLAIDEACQNIIRHAYHGETDDLIILHIYQKENTLVITLRDYAPEVSENCMKPRDLEDLRPGGLGCHFIQQVMDEVSVGPPSEGTGNMLQMVKHLA